MYTVSRFCMLFQYLANIFQLESNANRYTVYKVQSKNNGAASWTKNVLLMTLEF